MKAFAKLAAAVAFAAALIGASAAQASDETALLAQANRTVDHFRSDPAFAQAARMIHTARAVLIVPRLVKGGFIFGADGGDGVLLRRSGRTWSSPAFFSLASASFGLQIGLQQAELVMIIMTERGLRGIQQGGTKLGAGAGLTVVTLSSAAEGATTVRGGDIVVWSSGTGAYGGLTFNGSVVKANDDSNADFYGRGATVSAILANRYSKPGTRALQRNLATVW